jgi:hypothetical protein
MRRGVSPPASANVSRCNSIVVPKFD